MTLLCGVMHPPALRAAKPSLRLDAAHKILPSVPARRVRANVIAEAVESLDARDPHRPDRATPRHPRKPEWVESLPGWMRYRYQICSSASSIDHASQPDLRAASRSLAEIATQIFCIGPQYSNISLSI
ncbi:hypothetical protein [uncultured Thiocystis sp.]|uniref:hypothetical protein n=1 Tax=uncultured Thiocystis sp. TaxID=1202134 RepID=UPI0025F50E6A|nr:hypothetical protein [uncultured Thiocystis sp.]